MKQRPIYEQIWRTLDAFKPMIFMAGPRQVGKTTLARHIGRSFANHLYFNYDIVEDKRLLLEEPRFYEAANRKDDSAPLIILDEIHKHYDWKNYLKGAFDRDGGRFHFLVSGSGRLDVYQKGGDSLAGRYLLFHLWPFTLAELDDRRVALADFLQDPLRVDVRDEKGRRATWNRLDRMSGFPEPFLKDRADFHALWSRAYYRQILREDVRSLVSVQKADQMELLISLLPGRVGNPLSCNALASQIGVSFDSIKAWLGVFDDFFLTFRISPWTRKVTRAILKEQKAYLVHHAGISDPGARFENQVALELWRATRTWSETGQGDFNLHYVRTRDGEEVDFLLAESHRPILLVEAKAGDIGLSPALRKIQHMLGIPAVQLVNRPGIYRKSTEGGHPYAVISAEQWLAGLP